MAFLMDDLGNINLVQGDSGTLIVDGILTDKNYSVYFAFYNSNRIIVGEELCVNSNYNSVVTFAISGELTNLLTVNPEDETAEYYYGLKVCDPLTNYEDTLIVGDGEIGALNSVIVYPKKVEGI